MSIKATDEYSEGFGYNFGFAFGAMKSLNENFTVLLNGKIPFGTESIKYYDGNRSNFFIGLEISQNLIIKPGAGFGISMGFVETVLAGSKLHPWDIGFKVGIGGGF
jgi:hypothetical protein